MPIHQSSPAAFKFPHEELTYRVKTIFNEEIVGVELVVNYERVASGDIELYGFNLSDEVAVYLGSRQLQQGVDYTISKNSGTLQQTLKILNAGDQGVIKIKNTSHPKRNATKLGLHYDSSDSLIGDYRAQDLGLTTVIFSPHPEHNVATINTTVITDNNSKRAILNGNEAFDDDSDYIKELDANVYVYEDLVPKSSNALGFYLGDLYTASQDSEPDYYYRDGAHKVNLKIYASQDNFLHCDPFAYIVIKEALHYCNNRFKQKYQWDAFNIIALKNYAASHVANNSNLNFMPEASVMGIPLYATSATLFNVVDMVTRPIFFSSLTEAESERDILGLWRQKGFLDQFLGPLYTLDAVKKLKSSIENNSLTNAQRYSSLAYMLNDRLGADFEMTMNWFLTNRRANYSVEDLINWFNCVSEIDAPLKDFISFAKDAVIPSISIVDKYNADSKSYVVTITQGSNPVSIPLTLAFFYADGKQVTPDILINVNAVPENILRYHFPQRPILAVRLANNLINVSPSHNSSTQLLTLFVHDPDLENQYFAGEQLKQKLIKSLLDEYNHTSNIVIPADFLNACDAILTSSIINDAAKVMLLTIPPISEIAGFLPQVDIKVITIIRDKLCLEIAKKLEKELCKLRKNTQWDNRDDLEKFSRELAEQRAIYNFCTEALMCLNNDEYIKDCEDDTNVWEEDLLLPAMDTFANAYKLLLTNKSYVDRNAKIPLLLQKFYDYYSERSPDAMNVWFSLYGLCTIDTAIKDILKLKGRKSSDGRLVFDAKNSEHAQDLYVTFANNNPLFYAPDGEGFDFILGAIVEQDRVGNIAVVLELIDSFKFWYKFDDKTKVLMEDTLQALIANKDLSENCRERARQLINAAPVAKAPVDLASSFSFLPSFLTAHRKSETEKKQTQKKTTSFKSALGPT